MVKKLPGAEKKVKKNFKKKNLKDWTKWNRKWVVEVVSSQVVLLNTVYHKGYKRFSSAILKITSTVILKNKLLHMKKKKCLCC